MISLEALYQKLKQLFQEGVLRLNEVAYDSTNDWKKVSIENDSAGLAKESTLSSLNSKVVKADTDATKTIWDYAVENDLAFAGGKVFSIGSGDSVDVLFANPSGSGKTIKVRLLAAQGGAEGRTDIYTGSYGEDIVKTADGVSIPILNKKTGGTNTSVAVLQYDDTGTKYTINTTDKTENLIPGGSGNFATGQKVIEAGCGKSVPGMATITIFMSG